METAVTTVQMDDRGRVVIPAPVRQKLGIEGESATLELEVRHDD